MRDLEHGIELANRLAPEHLQIMARQPARLARSLVTAGAIFLGNESPTVLGDYVAGPSHTLPAGGTARRFAGLTVDQFQRRTSLVEYKKPAWPKAIRSVKKFAEIEGLDAHRWCGGACGCGPIVPIPTVAGRGQEVRDSTRL